MKSYKRVVHFRCGHLNGKKGPGLIFYCPCIDFMETIDIRTQAYTIPPQDVITKDNVSIQVNAVVYFQNEKPIPSVTQVYDYKYAVY